MIDYLDAGGYCGMDIDADFWRAGLEAMPPEVIAAKRPVCATISPAAIAQAAGLQAKFIASWQVIPAIPPAEEHAYFRSIAAMMSPDTIYVADLFETPALARLSPMAWGKPRQHVEEVLRRAAHDLSTEFVASPVTMSDKHAHTLLIARR